MKMGIIARDSITGFEGRVTAICEYITGCHQALVQPRVKDDGTFVEPRWIDLDRLTEQLGAPFELPAKQGGSTPGFDLEAPAR